MATHMTCSRSVCDPSVALLPSEPSRDVGDTLDPQSPDLHTPMPLEHIDPSLSLLAEPISLQEELLILCCQMALIQEKLECSAPMALPAQPPLPPVPAMPPLGQMQPLENCEVFPQSTWETSTLR